MDDDDCVTEDKDCDVIFDKFPNSSKEDIGYEDINPDYEKLLEDLLEVIYAKGAGLPVPAIMGVLDIVKDVVKANE